MTEKSLDLSGKIDGFTVELFATIANVAASDGISFFVVGATARDIILQYGYGIETIRATNDIDLALNHLFRQALQNTFTTLRARMAREQDSFPRFVNFLRNESCYSNWSEAIDFKDKD